MKEASNELESLISSLNLGSEEMHVEKCMQLVKEEIVDAKYNMAKLVDLAQGREVHLGSNWNEEPLEENNVDDQPTLIVKLPQACVYAQ